MPLIKLTPETRGDVPEAVLWLVEVPYEIGGTEPQFVANDNGVWLDNLRQLALDPAPSPSVGDVLEAAEMGYRFARPAEPHEIPGEDLSQSGTWINGKCVLPGAAVAKPLTFGRYMVEGGKGYRLLDPYGDFEPTDEVFYSAGSRWQSVTCAGIWKIGEKPPLRRPLASTPENYALLQAAWCEHFGVTVGTRVRVVRRAAEGELGWGQVWDPAMGTAIGDVGFVKEIVSPIKENYGLLVRLPGLGAFFPFHVLEPLPLDCEVCKAPISDKAWPTCEKCGPAPTDAKDVAERRRKRLERMCEDRQSLVEFMDGNCPIESVREGSVERLMADHVLTLRQMIETQSTQLTALREAAVGARDIEAVVLAITKYTEDGRDDKRAEAEEKLRAIHNHLDAALAQSTKGES